jgi:type I restriction enzyme R subunit
MVVTQNIETAIRYYKALARLLEKQGNPFKIAIAFSGEKEIDGMTHSEAQLNGFAENDTKDQFDSDDYRLLVVANKYLTGFDQPKLCAMYVDKKLTSVLCVQTLSRLNRSAPKWGKRTEDLFVLDFFNSVEDIKTAFDDFYTATSLSKATDVNVLHDLKEALDAVGVYEWYEVEDFIQRYFKGEDAQRLSPLIDIAVQRFDHELTLEQIAKVDFKIKAKQFVKIYGQLASIMPHQIVAWEALYWFLKFLIPKLKVTDAMSDAVDALLSSVDLSTYGLERVKLNHAITLDDSATELEPQNPNPRGVQDTGEAKDALDEIIKLFNEKWFQGWGATEEEKRIKFINLSSGIRNHPDYENKFVKETDPQKQDLVFENMMKSVMLQQRMIDLEFYKRYATIPEFNLSLTQTMKHILNQ